MPAGSRFRWSFFLVLTGLGARLWWLDNFCSLLLLAQPAALLLMLLLLQSGPANHADAHTSQQKILKRFIYIFYLYVYTFSVYVYHMHVGNFGSQKMASDPLKLELLVVMNHHVGVRHQTSVL